MCRLIKVSGRSLEPLYRDGDFVLTSQIPVLLGGYRPGDVVVLRHAVYGTLIKLVARLVPEEDALFVVGLREDSLDSTRFGAVPRRDVIGKVVWHIRAPASGRGRAGGGKKGGPAAG